EAGKEALASFDQIRQLVAFCTWIRSSSFSISELRFVLNGVESGPVKYTNTIEKISQAVLQEQATTGMPSIDALGERVAALFNVTVSRLADMLEWIAADINAPSIATALAASFTNDVPNDPSVLQPLLELVQQLERVALLFSNLKFADDTV